MKGIVDQAHDDKMGNITFASIYPCYIQKIEKKGRTQKELLEVIEWLTGFQYADLEKFIAEKVTMKTFFAHANLNPNAHLIKGVICGYKIEDIDYPLTQQVRYLDKLVDELAKGKKMDKILRNA